MAILLNSAGYLSTKWSRLLEDERLEEEQETIQIDEDGLENESEIEEIKKQMATRTAAKNKELICAILMNGGCTKGFSSIDELARHIYGKYNNRWKTQIRCTNERGPSTKTTTVSRQIHAPDLDGRVSFVGQLKTGKETYAVYSSPADSSCFYHSFSYMLQPLLKEDTPSPVALKRIVIDFYQKCTGKLRENLERLLCTTFKERYRDVIRPDNWGQYDDALCLATIMRLSFFIITVDSIKTMRVHFREEIVGHRVMGWKNSNTRGCERILVYFRVNSHYGVGVPI